MNGSYDPDLYSTIHYFSINDNEINYKYESDTIKEERTAGYKLIHKDGLLFLQMTEKFPYSIASYYEDAATSDLLLVLAGNQKEKLDKTIYSRGRVLFFAESKGFEQYGCFITPYLKFNGEIGRRYSDCTSFLKEGKIEYKVENLCNCKPGTPWVEGVSGDGIGEGFIITFPSVNTSENLYPYLLIMNGYISYDKPYLYKQNNRIKKIKVTGVTSGKSKILDVLDTPHPQTVDISFITEPEDVRVEIAEVYKGTKYDDTCINFCVTYPFEVIPYENSVK